MGFFRDIFGIERDPYNHANDAKVYQNHITALQAQAQLAHAQAQYNAQIAQAQMRMSHAGGLGMGAYSSGLGEWYRIDEDLQKLTRYAELCGDTVEVIELGDNELTDDVKVAILKAADVGKVVKGIGMKLSDTKFAVYRDQGE